MDKLLDVITKDEARLLLDQPNVKCPTGLRNRVILEVMYRAGLRVSEVIKLKPGHIRWQADGAELEVRASKGGKERVVPVEQQTRDWLSRWQEQRPKAGGRFFSTLQGKPLSRHYLGQMVARCAERAGIQQTEVREEDGKTHYKVHCHTLRHSYATEKLREGFTIAEVRDLLGHSNVQTTSVYLHSDPEILREKIQGKQEKEEKRADLQKQLDNLRQQIGELASA